MKSRVARPRRRRERDTSEYVDFARRILHATAERVGQGDVDDLRQLLDLIGELDHMVVEAVAGLRDSGATWEQIGELTGTTRQAAQMRWGAKVAELV